MLETITAVNQAVNSFIWGIPAMVCIIGVGLLLSVRTGFLQLRKFPYAIKTTIGRIFRKKDASDGAMTPFQAVCTALAATVGTGNIAGVAGAIAIGGPGAVFWMWCSALLGMCTKFSEVTLAVHFRERNKNGELVGGISKFVNPIKEKVVEALSLKANDFVALSAGKREAALKTAGVLVKTLGAAVPGHMDKEQYAFCWIVDFPMYEIGDESGELEFCHNPFSMPSGGLDVLLKAEKGEIDPLSITADQYDLVCNGVELSSGAVRNHDPEIMIKAFELVRLGEEDVKAKFPAMYNAFCYGAPPHAGIAPGVDRMVMLLAGEDSIREIIPFPMNKNAQDIMMGAPSEVTQKQLDELHIAVTAHEEE